MPENATATAIVNGRPRPVDGSTLADLLVELELPADGRGVAMAIDGEVVARGDWPARALRAGERVEVLTAMQGG